MSQTSAANALYSDLDEGRRSAMLSCLHDATTQLTKSKLKDLGSRKVRETSAQSLQTIAGIANKYQTKAQSKTMSSSSRGKTKKTGPLNDATLQSIHESLYSEIHVLIKKLQDREQDKEKRGASLISALPNCTCSSAKTRGRFEDTMVNRSECIDFNRYLVTEFRDCPEKLSGALTLANNKTEKYQRLLNQPDKFKTSTRHGEVLDDVYTKQFSTPLKADGPRISKVLAKQLRSPSKAGTLLDTDGSIIRPGTPAFGTVLKDRIDSFPHVIMGLEKSDVPRWGEYHESLASARSKGPVQTDSVSEVSGPFHGLKISSAGSAVTGSASQFSKGKQATQEEKVPESWDDFESDDE